MPKQESPPAIAPPAPDSKTLPWRGHWQPAPAFPEKRIYAFEYELTEDRPIAWAVKTYTACDGVAHFDLHYALECGFVSRGRLARYYGSSPREHICGAGDVWFCPSYEPNGYRLLETPCTVGVFEIRPELLADLRLPEAPALDWLAPFMAPVGKRPQPASGQRERILDIGRRLAVADKETPPGSQVEARLLLMEFLLLFVREQDVRSASSALPHAHETLWPAIDLALRERRFVPSAEAAAACGMNTPAFLRFFRKRVGISFAQFSRNRRLQEAAVTLAESDVPVHAIAEAGGFSDESHLHRLFLAHFGCTPRAYRRRARRVSPVVQGISGPP